MSQIKTFFTRYPWIWISAFSIIYLSLFLESFPDVYIDEPWESITAYRLYHNFELNYPPLKGWAHYDQHLLEPRIVQSVIMGAFYYGLGLNLWVGRFASLLVAFLSLYFFYRLLKFSKLSVFLIGLGIALLAANNYFFIFARRIRPEIYLTLLTIASFYFLYRGINENQKKHFLAGGFLMGLGLYTHPNFVLVIIAYGLILLVEYRQRIFKEKNVWILIFSTAMAFLPYAIYVVIQDSGNGFSHFWAQIQDRATQDDSDFWKLTFVNEFKRYGKYLSYPEWRVLKYIDYQRIFIVSVEIIFLALSFRLKDKLSRFALIIIFCHIFLFPILIVSREARYFLPVIPFIVLLICKNLEHQNMISYITCFSKFRQGALCDKLIVAIVILMLVNQFSSNLFMMNVFPRSNYNQFISDIRQHIPPESKVWGNMQFWFGFSDCEYRTQYSMGEDLIEFQPDYIITNDYLLWTVRKKKFGNVTKKIDTYANMNYVIIAEIPDNFYGHVKIYRRKNH